MHKRSIRKFFVPAVGEVVTSAGWWKDIHVTGRQLIVVSTNCSVCFLKADGSPLVTILKSNHFQTVMHVGFLEKPTRYFVWYLPQPGLVEPRDFRAAPSDLYVYDSAGHELDHQTVPPPHYPVASSARALFGLVTPMSEAATLLAASRHLRSQASRGGNNEKPVLLDYLENSRFYIPGTEWYEVTPEGLIPGYLGLILLSASISALFCFWLTRRHAFSLVGSVRWSLVGFFFGWVGVALMLAIREWPARKVCPNCRKQRPSSRSPLASTAALGTRCPCRMERKSLSTRSPCKSQSCQDVR